MRRERGSEFGIAPLEETPFQRGTYVTEMLRIGDGCRGAWR
jgi:hypothetical protein